MKLAMKSHRRALENEGIRETSGVLMQVSGDAARVNEICEAPGLVARCLTTLSKPHKVAQSLRGLHCLATCQLPICHA